MRVFLAAILTLGALGLFVLAGIWLETAADEQGYQWDDETYRIGAAFFVALGGVLAWARSFLLEGAVHEGA